MHPAVPPARRQSSESISRLGAADSDREICGLRKVTWLQLMKVTFLMVFRDWLWMILFYSYLSYWIRQSLSDKTVFALRRSPNAYQIMWLIVWSDCFAGNRFVWLFAHDIWYVVPYSENRCTGWCKRNVSLFENSRRSAARQLGHPMHSQSANFEKFKLNSLNLAPFLLLNPVLWKQMRLDWTSHSFEDAPPPSVTWAESDGAEEMREILFPLDRIMMLIKTQNVLKHF